MDEEQCEKKYREEYGDDKKVEEDKGAEDETKKADNEESIGHN